VKMPTGESAIPRSFFVTGTDTDVGKTFVSQALLLACNKKGFSTSAYKPVAAGCEKTPDGLHNEDALLLQAASSIALSYQDVNPIAFAEAVAPHLACAQLVVMGKAQPIELHTINQGYLALQQKQANVLLVEGAGGWRLPLGPNALGREQFLSDFAIAQQLPVILVVGMRLGCLNHALLSAQAIERDGLLLAGWVANLLDPQMPYLAQNVDSLSKLLNAPLIGSLPIVDHPEQAVQYLDLSVMGLD
jgi:dethiobiotin synthetase